MSVYKRERRVGLDSDVNRNTSDGLGVHSVLCTTWQYHSGEFVGQPGTSAYLAQSSVVLLV